MPNYNNFDQILRDKKLSESGKNAFVKRWLKNTYAIDFDDNPGFFTELSRVHDHDGQPLHFGRLLLDTAFGSAGVQLVRNVKNQKWRIGLFNGENDQEPVILAPINSANGQDHGELQQFKNLLTAPPRQQTNDDGEGGTYANLDMYSNPGLSPEELEAQYRNRVAPNVIPAYLYDPAYRPGVDPDAEDPTLNKDIDEVVATWLRATNIRSIV